MFQAHSAGFVPLFGSSKGSGWVSRLEWSPKGTLLAAASGKELLVVDRDGQLVRRFAVPSTATDLVWSVDGSRVAVSAYGGVQWFLPDGPSDAAVKTMAWKGSILKMAQSATGAWLCHGNQDNSVHIWKVKSGDELEISGYPAKVDVLEFDGSGRWLAVGTVGHTSVWDCAGKGPRGRRPVACEGHSRRVTAVAWRPRTTTLASGAVIASGVMLSDGVMLADGVVLEHVDRDRFAACMVFGACAAGTSVDCGDIFE